MTTKYPHANDWEVSDTTLSDAIKAIKKKVRIDCTKDIPYVAGYSRDGKIIYIDCELPEFMSGNKKLNVWTAVSMHEAVEKALLDAYNVPYQLAHQIALRVERSIVEAAGVSWKAYNAWMEKWIKDIGSRKAYPNSPKNLDLTPYEDENDEPVLRKLK